MVRETRFLAAVFSFLFLLAASGSVSAVTYYGCFYCRPVAPTGMGATCRQVGDGPMGKDGSVPSCTTCHGRTALSVTRTMTRATTSM